MKNKKLIIILLIFVICFIISLLIIFNTNNNLISNSVLDNNILDSTSISLENNINIEQNNIIENKQNTIIEDSNSYIKSEKEIQGYWDNYTNPNHWSEKTKKNSLAYALMDNKIDNMNEYITQPDEVISSHLPTNSRGFFITQTSRMHISLCLEKQGIKKIYIDNNGMLKYNKQQYEVETPLEKFFNSILNNADKLYILDVSFAYVDEAEGTNPYTMPGEINYLGFNINDKQKLFVYNLYNFDFDIFIEGLEKLTNQKLETK